MILVRFICNVFTEDTEDINKLIYKDVTVDTIYPDVDDYCFSDEGKEIIQDWFCEEDVFKHAIGKMNEYIDAWIKKGCNELTVAIEFGFDYTDTDYMEIDYANVCRALIEYKEDEFCNIFTDADIPVKIVKYIA